MSTKFEQRADLVSADTVEWEKSVLGRIGKQIEKTAKTDAADIQKLNNISTVMTDMRIFEKELEELTQKNIERSKQIYADEIADRHLLSKALYDYRKRAFVPFGSNPTLQNVARTYVKSTSQILKKISNTDALCVKDKDGNFVTLKKGYYDVLNRVAMRIAGGSFDIHATMRESIRQLGSGGLCVNYGSGVAKRLDAVIRQEIMRGAKQVNSAYSDIISEELGCDGIEIDYHANPRPSHAFMQGKQYVLGRARKCNGVYFESADEVLKRLNDYNCYHYKTPIICGISEPRYSKKELAELKKRDEQKFDIGGRKISRYEADQEMRRLETAIREQKGIKTIAQSSGDKIETARCNERIKRYQEKYTEISDITGVEQDKKRMTLTNGGTSGKIKENSTNKVTPITDNAIKNVKKVEISGFSDIQNDYIHTQHKELLKYARDNNESKEVAFVFRKDLSDKTVFAGSEHSVEFESGLFGKGDGLFIMHNHPNNSTFSDRDIQIMVSDKNIQTISVVKNNGGIEVLTKSAECDEQNTKTHLKRAYKKYVKSKNNNEEITKAIDYFLNHNGGNFVWVKK